jgi:hypothetical protein
MVNADINLLGDSVNTIKENSETLLVASRDTGREINAEKTKYMIISHHPNSEQNQNMTANELFENVAKFKYLGMTQIRMTFMMKLGENYIRGMLAILQSKIFCLPISYKKT